MKPLVKWVGGKTKLSPSILERVPLAMTEYHEPFVGGAAVFCALSQGSDLNSCSQITLGDTNADLMDLYRTVRHPARLEQLISNLLYLERKYNHPERDAERLYYEQRDLWNSGKRTAARFVFLKQTAFNGLWRVNKSEELNASWGKYVRPKFLDEGNLRGWHKNLQDVDLRTGSFTELRPGSGAVVYVDPPYYGAFDGYTSKGFTHADHVRLLCHVWKWRNAGAFVIYSNSLNEHLVGLLQLIWPEADLDELTTQYVVNCDGTGRTDALELLASG